MEHKIIIIIILLLLLTAIGLSPGGSGYFTCIQNMKLVTNKFKSEGLHEKLSGGLHEKQTCLTRIHLGPRQYRRQTNVLTLIVLMWRIG